jgi:plasmid stability protein
MKTTFDLPPDLVRAVKIRAVHEGRKLKDVATDLLKRGLAGPETPAKLQSAKPRIEIQANGLPVVRCMAVAPAKRMTAGELLALEQETLHQEDLQRPGHAL